VREIRLHGSEGGAAETNRSFLPLSMSLGAGVAHSRLSLRERSQGKNRSFRGAKGDYAEPCP
jgi:hypothetical protein